MAAQGAEERPRGRSARPQGLKGVRGIGTLPPCRQQGEEPVGSAAWIARGVVEGVGPWRSWANRRPSVLCYWTPTLPAVLGWPPLSQAGLGGWSLQGRRPVWVQQPRLWVGGSPGTPVLLGIRVGLGLQLRGWGEPSGPHRLKLPRQGGGPPPGATQTFPCTCTHVGAHMCTMHTNAHKAHRHKHRHKAHVPTSTHGTRGHMQKAHTPTC